MPAPRAAKEHRPTPATFDSPVKTLALTSARLQSYQAVPRMRVVWAVCDVGGRTVATFDYTAKAEAEAQAAALKARGKGTHFVRSVKELMSGGG